jgi:hypothetical protein
VSISTMKPFAVKACWFVRMSSSSTAVSSRECGCTRRWETSVVVADKRSKLYFSSLACWSMMNRSDSSVPYSIDTCRDVMYATLLRICIGTNAQCNMPVQLPINNILRNVFVLYRSIHLCTIRASRWVCSTACCRYEVAELCIGLDRSLVASIRVLHSRALSFTQVPGSVKPCVLPRAASPPASAQCGSYSW